MTSSGYSSSILSEGQEKAALLGKAGRQGCSNNDKLPDGFRICAPLSHQYSADFIFQVAGGMSNCLIASGLGEEHRNRRLGPHSFMRGDPVPGFFHWQACQPGDRVYGGQHVNA
jgi:hypothetical protein